MTDGRSSRYRHAAPHSQSERSAARQNPKGGSYLRIAGEELATSIQNISEFWNVCTRPASARGGLGLTFEQAEKRLKLIERLVTVLHEPPTLYEAWRRIVLTHRVMGVKVHDAKLVAAMELHGINGILTLNAMDFARYPSVSVITP